MLRGRPYKINTKDKYCALCRDPPDASEVMQECFSCGDKFHLVCIKLQRLTVPPEEQYKCDLCKEYEGKDEKDKNMSEEETLAFQNFHDNNYLWYNRLNQEKVAFIKENVEDLQLFCPAKTIEKLLKADGGATTRGVKEISPAEYDAITILTETPSYIKGSMKNYQLEGVSTMSSWFCRGVGGILADEMGLGKTLQTIAFIAQVKHVFGLSGPHLVVVPLAVIQNWCNEINRFCPTLTFKKLHGSMAERRHLFEDREVINCKFDIYLTTYDTLISEEPFFTDSWSWITVSIDEGHRIKNENARLRSCLSRLRSSFRLLLTGTPLQNNMHELWALLDYILPDIFGGQSDRFDSAFSADKDLVNTDICRRARKLLDVHMMLRRLKSEVETALLPKHLVKIPVPITPFQKKWYDKIVDKGLVFNALSQKQLNHKISQLRKIVNHPKQILLKLDEDRRIEANRIASAAYAGSEFLSHDKRLTLPEFGSGEWIAEDEMRSLTGERLIKSCSKLMALDMLLLRLRKSNSRCLVFSQFTETLDILEEYVNYRFGKMNEVYFRLDGNTNRVIRELNIRAFNHPDAKSFIYLISTTAGGVGINLATAESVILYDSSWNPQIDLQAQDRAHRIGQKKQVTIYRLIAENTFEERVLQMAERKQILDKLVINMQKSDLENIDMHQKEAEMSISELENALHYGINKLSLTSKSIRKMGADDFAAMLERRLVACLANPVDMSGSFIRKPENGSSDLTNDSGDVTCPLCLKMYTLNGYTLHVSQGVCERDPEGEDGVSSSSTMCGGGSPIGPTIAMAIESNETADADETSESDENSSDDAQSNSMEAAVSYAPKGAFDDLFVSVVKTVGVGDFKSTVELATIEADRDTGFNETKRTRKPVNKFVPHDFYENKPKEKKLPRISEDMCFICFGRPTKVEGTEEEIPLVRCKLCPKAYHCVCVGLDDQLALISCPWHYCVKCKRNASNSGGTQFRCMDCPTSSCFDCWPQDKEMVNYEPPKRFVDNFTKRGFDLSKNIMWYRCCACEEKKGKFINYIEQKSIPSVSSSDSMSVYTPSAAASKKEKQNALWCNTLSKSDLLNLLFAEKIQPAELALSRLQGLHKYTDPYVFTIFKMLSFSLGDKGNKKISTMLLSRTRYGTITLYLQGKEGNKRSKQIELAFLESINEFCELDSYIDYSSNPNVASILNLFETIHQRKQNMESTPDDQLESKEMFCGILPKSELMDMLFTSGITPVNLSHFISFGYHYYTDSAVYAVCQDLVRKLHQKGLIQQQVVSKVSMLLKLDTKYISQYLYGKLNNEDTKFWEYKMMDFLFEYCLPEIKGKFNLSDENSAEDFKRCNNLMLNLFRTVIANHGKVLEHSKPPSGQENANSSEKTAGGGFGGEQGSIGVGIRDQTEASQIPGYTLISIIIPKGVYPGDHFKFFYDNLEYAIKAPDGCFPGQMTQTYIPTREKKIIPQQVAGSPTEPHAASLSGVVGTSSDGLKKDVPIQNVNLQQQQYQQQLQYQKHLQNLLNPQKQVYLQQQQISSITNNIDSDNYVPLADDQVLKNINKEIQQCQVVLRTQNLARSQQAQLEKKLQHSLMLKHMHIEQEKQKQIHQARPMNIIQQMQMQQSDKFSSSSSSSSSSSNNNSDVVNNISSNSNGNNNKSDLPQVCIMLQIPATFSMGKTFIFGSQGLRYRFVCPEGSPGNSVKVWIPKNPNATSTIDKDSPPIILDPAKTKYEIVSKDSESTKSIMKTTSNTASNSTNSNVSLISKNDELAKSNANPTSITASNSNSSVSKASAAPAACAPTTSITAISQSPKSTTNVSIKSSAPPQVPVNAVDARMSNNAPDPKSRSTSISASTTSSNSSNSDTKKTIDASSPRPPAEPFPLVVHNLGKKRKISGSSSTGVSSSAAKARVEKKRPGRLGRPPGAQNKKPRVTRTSSSDLTAAVLGIGKEAVAAVENSVSIPLYGQYDESSCSICGLKENEDKILLCDGLNCNREWHMYCLTPSLEDVPEGNWLCPHCIRSGNTAMLYNNETNTDEVKEGKGDGSDTESEYTDNSDDGRNRSSTKDMALNSNN